MNPTRSLAGWRSTFHGLAAPEQAACNGFWRVEFVGPFWLRYSAPWTIALSGLPGWQGKQFFSTTAAVNVLRGEKTCLPMQVLQERSWLDGKPALVCRYGETSPLPWRYVRDEFRALTPTSWLGMTMIDLPGLRQVGWPFVLRQP